ncbi:MAG: 5,10-methylenetetrahydrofolate reductase, partial [Actinomyces sp.]
FGPAARRLVAEMTYEVVPMAGVDAAIEALPAGSPVSVTCSPVKGIDATRELTERLLAAGHRPVPHLAARMVASRDETRRLAAWARQVGLHALFVVAGDAPEPAGPYEGAVPFLADLIEAGPGVAAVGVTAYPDGHALIDEAELVRALHAKQALLTEAGVEAWASTQMCFDTGRIRSWLEDERRRGLTLDIHLGMAGVVDRAKLMTMGVRLGIGASLRYLRKNRASVTRMLAPGGYDPSHLVVDLAPDADRLGITGLHVFTFNNVAATRHWQEAVTSGEDAP